MVLRLLDEVLRLEGRGIVLLSMDEENAPRLYPGARLIDARGRSHTVARVEEHEGLYTLRLPEGDAAYFERLFRDVRVDATRFDFEPEEEPSCR